MTFDIRQLLYTIAAADHGSFCRAARALDIEQSTLSRNILKLERAADARTLEVGQAPLRFRLRPLAYGALNR